jgi:4-hydroxybenzoate polyprenyltransferase
MDLWLSQIRTINETSREGRETILSLCFCWPFVLASAAAGQGPPTHYWELMLLFLVRTLIPISLYVQILLIGLGIDKRTHLKKG